MALVDECVLARRFANMDERNTYCHNCKIDPWATSRATIELLQHIAHGQLHQNRRLIYINSLTNQTNQN